MGKTVFRSINEAFLRMEDELDLFGQKMGDVYFWERIRFPLHQKIMRSTDLIGPAPARLERTISNSGRSALRSLRNGFIKNPYLAPKSEVLFLGSARRKLGDDGKWWDIYCDPIIDHLNRSYVYFENPYLVGHLKPARTQCIKYLDLPLYLAAVRRKIGLVRVSLSKSDVRLLKAIQVKLQERFRVRIDVEGMVYRDLLLRKSLLPGYQALLKKVAPRIAVLVCSYGRETFVEACKTTGIPVVELQHGTISAYHLGYSFPGDNRTKRIFPDFLFLFGDFWKEGVDYPIPQERVFSVGYPYLESEAEKYSALEQKDQLVFISQRGNGKAISKFAVRLSREKDSPLEIVYKLHPGEYLRWRKDYPWLAEADIQVVADDEIPLYQLFAESRIQVGVNSTAIVEGLRFGLKTFLLDLPGVEHMERLVSRGTAAIVSSVGEIVKKAKGKSFPRVEIANFFKPNASKNVINVLEKLFGSSLSM